MEIEDGEKKKIILEMVMVIFSGGWRRRRRRIEVDMVVVKNKESIVNKVAGYDFFREIRDGKSGTHRHHPRTVDGLTVCPAGQVTDRSSCPWIDAPKAQLQSRLTVDQYGPSIDPRSIGLTVGGTHGHYPRTIDGLTVRPAGPWFVTENFPRTQSENLAKCDLRPDLRSVG
ncbi:hypothetical protein MTR67_034678 [Solanum verrucosum]|uniref:Late blight resistance protein n=1 Tax=Solanum verrucosum TaxID=315347 RepID=A0AAF0U8P1_SOLVR|nr:hypothetical protein MTR67_034678 [Solanum verrucosum]